jgi:uncharacterized protein (TIGR02300 family)
MPKEEWGVKRVCPTTGKRFYDLGRSPVVSPYTGEAVVVEAGGKNRVLVADKADPAAAKKEVAAEEDVLLEEDDIEDDVEVDDEDDVLDEDGDDDTVSIDEIGDVGEEKDEE